MKTETLKKARGGDPQSRAKLLEIVYDKLRAIAAGYMKGERQGHTLQPTALVHEAYLQLVKPSEADFNDRTHFVAVAACAMRRVLVDHARRRNALKRGGDHERVALEDSLALCSGSQLDLIRLDEALSALESVDARKARVVELRFFGGLSNEETSAELGIAVRTVEDDWFTARAWLHRELSR